MIQRRIGGILTSAERESMPDVAAAWKRLVSIHYNCLKRETFTSSRTRPTAKAQTSGGTGRNP